MVARGEGLTEQVDAHMEPGRDHWYHEVVAAAAAECEAEVMDAEDLLYIL